jgi:hypothetical protein
MTGRDTSSNAELRSALDDYPDDMPVVDPIHDCVRLGTVAELRDRIDEYLRRGWADPSAPALILAPAPPLISAPGKVWEVNCVMLHNAPEPCLWVITRAAHTLNAPESEEAEEGVTP